MFDLLMRISLLFLSACIFWSAPLIASATPEVIDDVRIKAGFQKGLESLVQEKKPTSLAELNRQLSRSKTTIKVAGEPASRKIPKDKIYERCKSSVLLVGRIYKCDKCTKWHVSSASGFAVTTDGVIATNYHVIEGKDGAALGAMDFSGKTYFASEVLAASKADDIALLKLEGATLTPLSLSQNTAPVGSSVHVISHPNGRYFTMTSGDVSRYYLSRNTRSPRVAITADYAKGSSGAPVIDSRGSVVGVVSSTNSIYYNKVKGQDQNLQMVVKSCIPVGAIKSLIE